MTARAVRIAAGTDQTGHHAGRVRWAPPSAGPDGLAGGAEGRKAASGRRRVALISGIDPV